MIREMNSRDSLKILEIYKSGIETRNATFETEVPTWEIWDSRHITHSRFVFEENGKVLGWAALSLVSSRKAYSGVAEISIYVDINNYGRKIGSNLMKKIISSSEENEIWTIHSSIFPENIPTLKLHEKFGFRIIGRRERIGKLDGKWRDTILLERRSRIIGL